MTRRSILTMFGMAPALMVPLAKTVCADSSCCDEEPCAKCWPGGPGDTDRTSPALPPHLLRLIRECDYDLGDMGRGHKEFTVHEIISLKNELHGHGFSLFSTPGKCGTEASCFPVYTPYGGLVAAVWFGFVRERNGRGEVVAFECSQKHIVEFRMATGLTLYQAIKETA